MSTELGTWRRTHDNGGLRPSDVGREVTLMGWVHNRRDLGGLIFIDLRDREGITQVVCNPQESVDAAAVGAQLRSEYVVGVRGVVAGRPAGTENAKLATGQIEVRARELRVLNPSETPPFPIADDGDVDEAVRLRYRYLDLRRPRMLERLRLRHRAAKAIRDFLSADGFLEVETPMLIKGTPEGARDFLVPSRLQPGKFYALPQSPQLFKQILMVAGAERYFQIVRCFRDEDLRADRQPEFTQVDIEMSFVDRDDVLSLGERMIASVLRDTLGRDVALPLPRLTYAEAMDRYGSDKPDLRFGMEIADCSSVFQGTGFQVFAQALASGGAIRGICVPGAAGYSRREVQELEALAKTAGARGLVPVHLDADGVRGAIARHLSPDTVAALRARLGGATGDLLLLVAGAPADASAALGRLRLDLVRLRPELHERVGFDRNRLSLLWVLEFPLFERGSDKSIAAVHHPFTAPVDADLPKLEHDPLGVRAKAYDLVLNGVELGGGSIRIHRRELQQRVFSVLGISPEIARQRFGFLLDAFQYGAPPHGGIALGFDRMVMLLAGDESIREVIAFPKTQSATDLMTGAPSEVDPEALEEVHIQIRDRDTR
ncbi:MAG TPA: aspartate--tRNA ligase [bacterium]|nr:aspartate--tRNA ligase [bacterium]